MRKITLQIIIFLNLIFYKIYRYLQFLQNLISDFFVFDNMSNFYLSRMIKIWFVFIPTSIKINTKVRNQKNIFVYLKHILEYFKNCYKKFDFFLIHTIN